MAKVVRSFFLAGVRLDRGQRLSNAGIAEAGVTGPACTVWITNARFAVVWVAAVSLLVHPRLAGALNSLSFLVGSLGILLVRTLIRRAIRIRGSMRVLIVAQGGRIYR
eukprot:1086023-Amorphochlora_amoeboformis.AAC.1